MTSEEPSNLAAYLRGSLRADVVAGLTVAILGVPQAMAYALVAGLPPVYGLYTAIVSCAVAALLGSSRHLVTGPTNGLSLVLFSLTVHLADSHPGVTVFEAILLLSLMSGVVQLTVGLLRFGGVVRYVANSVVVGFTAGAGVLIAVNQVHNVLGVSIHEAGATRTVEVVIATAERVGRTNFHALAIGALTALMVLLPKMHPRLKRVPGALLGIAVSGAVSYLLGWHLLEPGSKVEIIKDIEPGIRGSLDIFHVPELLRRPDLALTAEFVPGALAVSILSLIEATSISRMVARSSRQRLDFSRELVGQGASKIVGAFFSCFAASGSFLRTTVCYRSGGRTRMAAVFSAGWTAATLLLFGPVANYIPKPALAGMIIVIAYSMVDRERIRLSWQSGRNSQIVLVGTLVSTLVLPLQTAIYVGVGLSLFVILRATGRTDLTQLVSRPDGDFDEVPMRSAPPSPVVTINMSGDIYFAAAEDLDTELLSALTPETRVVVLRMKRLRAAGSTAMAMLEQFYALLHERRVYLVVCGIGKDLEKLLTKTGLRRRIGEENIFYSDSRMFQSTWLAIARANAVHQRHERIERRRRREAGRATEVALQRGPAPIAAQQLMTTAFPLFGNEHQTREAVWLFSEQQKHRASINPAPLFLRDRDTALFGELSRWHVLRALVEGSEAVDADALDDAQLAELLRRHFLRPVSQVARTDVVRHRADTPLATLLRTAADNDQGVVPICDEAGRLKGYCTSNSLLAGLGDALTALPERDDVGEERGDG
ncbi:MAG: STAS domain-containing protein [Planctomycetes bacterium]|nr:STAS domain-containing protein [Planctomycetota bacterium]